ncbi:MAG: CehA/McbA family metallohydrolase [Kofleriaceae bacterium]
MKAALALLAACGGHASGSFQISVTDHGSPIAARVLLIGRHFGTIDLYDQRQGAGACAWGPGVVGTWDGIVLGKGQGAIPIGNDKCSVPAGHYQVWAWHGIDCELYQGDIDVEPGAKIEIPLTRAWTPKALAADLHVHAHDSNDSNMPDEQRVAAQAAAGIRVTAFSNHNKVGDATPAIHQLGLDMIGLPSAEITAESMHAGVYPVTSIPPAAKIIPADPKTLLAMLRALPDHPVIQINHPRFRYQSLFDTTHWDGVSWPPPFPTDFDAIEMPGGYSANNSPGDRRIDDLLRDFYTFYQHGVTPAAVGGSDTHDFNWVLDGTSRTYVFSDPEHVVDGIRARHTEATTGPYLEVDVDGVGPGGTVHATDHVHYKITVAQAAFVKATTLTIQLGTTQTVLAVKPGTQHFEGDLPVAGATFFGVSVIGEEPLPLEVTGTYQKDKWQKGGITPFAVISPITIL